jgi:hypothetical protein
VHGTGMSAGGGRCHLIREQAGRVIFERPFLDENGVRPIGSPPTGYQSQLSSNTGSNDSTVVYAVCRP